METSVIRLGVDEFGWLARELVRFCSAKGDPLWERTIKVGSDCWLSQLRKNTRGRFIVFCRRAHSGKSRTIFRDSPNADGWFRVTKILTQMLILETEGAELYQMWQPLLWGLLWIGDCPILALHVVNWVMLVPINYSGGDVVLWVLGGIFRHFRRQNARRQVRDPLEEG